MEIKLYTAHDEKYLLESNPIGLQVTFDDNVRFCEGHDFEPDGVSFEWIYKEGSAQGVFLSKDSIKLLHATLGAYLGK